MLTIVIAASKAALLPSRSYLPSSQGSQSSSINSGFIQTSGSSGAVNTRPQQEVEKNAAILKQDQDVTETGELFTVFVNI